MKNLLLIIIIFIISVNIIGCNSMKKNTNNDNLRNEISKIEDDNSTSEVEESDIPSSVSNINKDIIEDKNNEEQNQSTKDIADDEFFNLFTMIKSEVIKYLGDSFEILEEVHSGTDEAYVYKEFGFTIYFDEHNSVEMIACSPNYKLLGVTPKMEFSEIQRILGNTEIIEIGDINKSYRIVYKINGYTVLFTYPKSEGGYNTLLVLPQNKINK